jgi:hypothetical protein
VPHPAWATLGAGLGGSFLGLTGALGVAWMQARGSGRAAVASARRDAYSHLLAAGVLVIHTAYQLRSVMELSSGLAEGAGVLMGARKPIDPLEVHWVLRRDAEPIHQAWAAVWTVGSPEAIRLANDLVEKAGEVMSGATVPGEGRSKAMRFLAGEKWTPAQVEAWDGRIRTLALARRTFAEQARRELGMEVAQLFTAAPEEQA